MYSPAGAAFMIGVLTAIARTAAARRGDQVLMREQPGKVFSMATSGNMLLLVGTAQRHIWIWDLRNMQHPLQRRESALKHQTRCVRCFPDGQGFVVTSIEGRAAVEYFDPSPEVQTKKYAFKCHRRDVDGVQTAYPVNTVSFHPVHGTFATGGCDGIVNIWDGAAKKRLCQLHRYPTSIASVAFNSDGSLLAIASSYTFEEGQKDHAPDTVFVRSMTNAETMPKA